MQYYGMRIERHIGAQKLPRSPMIQLLTDIDQCEIGKRIKDAVERFETDASLRLEICRYVFTHDRVPYTLETAARLFKQTSLTDFPSPVLARNVNLIINQKYSLCREALGGKDLPEWLLPDDPMAEKYLELRAKWQQHGSAHQLLDRIVKQTNHATWWFNAQHLTGLASRVYVGLWEEFFLTRGLSDKEIMEQLSQLDRLAHGRGSSLCNSALSTLGTMSQIIQGDELLREYLYISPDELRAQALGISGKRRAADEAGEKDEKTDSPEDGETTIE